MPGWNTSNALNWLQYTCLKIKEKERDVGKERDREERDWRQERAGERVQKSVLLKTMAMIVLLNWFHCVSCQSVYRFSHHIVNAKSVHGS